MLAKKGDPVAVVYYYCKLKGGKCTPRDGLYYVHNGVAVEDLPVGKGGAKVYHVSGWELTGPKTGPKIDELHICGPEEAADPPSGITCHHNSKGIIDRWVVKAIYSYSGEPIAWRVGNETHNGAFKCFQRKGQPCDSDIGKVAGKTLQGTLEFWHYVNNPPYETGEDGRTAKSWKKFTHQQGWVPGKGQLGEIQIAKM